MNLILPQPEQLEMLSSPETPELLSENASTPERPESSLTETLDRVMPRPEIAPSSEALVEQTGELATQDVQLDEVA